MPIIFDAESIRAIRDGRKTQTRRVVDFGPDPTPYIALTHAEQVNGLWSFYSCDPERFPREIRDRPGRNCPYGRVGDLLWVREHLRWGEETWVYSSDGDVVHYDKAIEHVAMSWSFHKETTSCAPIHMPRWASRLTLKLTDVRVQRVQEICDSDAVDEGVEYRNGYFHGSQHRVKGTPKCFPDAPSAFADRWDAINAKRGYPWASNPWVWALTFKPIWKNIDAVKGEP